MRFDDIINELEKDSEILKFRFSHNNVPMYLNIKHHLIQALVNEKFKLDDYSPAVKKNFIIIFEYLFFSIKQNLFFAPKKDIYIFSSGIVNRKLDGKYDNFLYGNFEDIYKNDTQIIESSVGFSYLNPKKRKIYFYDIVRILTVLLSKFYPISQEDNANIKELINYLRNSTKLNINEKEYDCLNKNLRKQAKRNRIESWIFDKVFKWKKPKLIIVEDAWYGQYASLLMAAKQNNIITAEYQHGYVGKSHRAYNYHSQTHKVIEEYFPQYFLTHGKYWSEQINIPSKKIVIGYPSITQNFEQKNKIEKNKNKILFISSGAKYKELITIIDTMHEFFNDGNYNVSIRPHPSEYADLKNRYSYLTEKGISIDTDSLYDSLSNSEFIVSIEHTTVLFEAILYTKKIYLMSSDYTLYSEPEPCFKTFVNINQLKALIKDKSEVDLSPNYFWDSNWKQNYINFIENIIGIKK